MARYFLNIGTDTNSTANWSDTSGGAGGFSVPTNTDDVFFDANSGPAILTATFDCRDLNTTGFVGTIDINSRSLRMQGSLTLSATTVITRTTGAIQIQGSSTPLTLTTNGVNLPYIGFQGTNIVYNLSGDIDCDVLTISNPCTINNNNIYVSTTLNNSAFITAGTTNLVIDGAATLTSTAPLFLPVIVNSASAITFSGVCAFRNLTYITAASVTTTGSTLSTGNNTAIWNTNGIIWDNVLIGAGAVTLGSDFRYTGTLTAATANTALLNGAYNVYLGAVLTTGGAGSGLGGTATLVCDGTTTWTASGAAGVKMNFNVLSTANLTISGTVYYNTGTLTIDPAATVITTGNTLYITANTTLNCASVNWNNLTFQNTITITLLDHLNIDGTFNAGGNSGAFTTTINGSDTYFIYCNGNITNSNGSIRGATKIYAQGSGTINMAVSTIAVKEFILDGDYTIGVILFQNLEGVMLVRYNSGTVTSTNRCTVLNNVTMDTGANVLWYEIAQNGAGSNMNLASDLHCITNNTTFNGLTLTGAYNYYCKNLIGTGINTLTSATTKIVLNPDTTGSWSLTGPINCNVDIDCTGTLTFAASTIGLFNSTGVAAAKTFRIVAGTVVTTGNTFNVGGNWILDTAGINFNIVNIFGVASYQTFQLDSLLTATTIRHTGPMDNRFTGAYGFTCANFQTTFNTAASPIWRFTVGNTYRVTSSLSVLGISGSNQVRFFSLTTSSYATFTLDYGATQSVKYANATDIDSSAGQTIMAGINSTLLRTINWQLTEGNWWLVLNRA